MEKWKVVGFRLVDFTANDGKKVEGYKLYLAREPQDEHIHGLETHTQFYSKGLIDYVPKENDIVVIMYNRYGKVASISPEVK